jgi:hypothetical protein
VLVAYEQGVEEQFVNSLGLRVDSNPWVEIRGTTFDDHHQRVGVGSF